MDPNEIFEDYLNRSPTRFLLIANITGEHYRGMLVDGVTADYECKEHGIAATLAKLARQARFQPPKAKNWTAAPRPRW